MSASLTLYISGETEASRAHRDGISATLERISGRTSLEVVDVLLDPARAEQDRVLTTPMLVRWDPKPVQRLVGAVSDGDIAALLSVGNESSQDQTRPVSPDRSSEVLSRASHELRTPLAVIRGFAGTLQESIGRMDHDMSKKAADAIVRSSIQLQAMLESMLVVETVEADGLHLDLSDWELGDIALETIRDLQPLLASHVVKTSITDGLWVRVDAAKIRQVITNLLTNAVKFSERDTRISLTVALKDGAGVVAVEDEGRGIPYQHLEKLFAKYERLGGGEKGTGLGLYIARGLARAHGGDVKAFSDGTTGSRFELILPLLGT